MFFALSQDPKVFMKPESLVQVGNLLRSHRTLKQCRLDVVWMF